MKPELSFKPEPLAALLARLRDLPIRPQTHIRLLQILANPDVSNEVIAGLVNKDVALTAHVLKVANSALFAPVTYICSTSEAVAVIGTMQLRVLVNTAWAFQLMTEVKGAKGFCLKTESRHALEVAAASVSMARAAQCEPALIEEVFTAAMLHDVGKTLMAVHSPDIYSAVSELSERRMIPRWEAEKNMLGYNHADLGGSLMDAWGLSKSIVAAIKWHHEPQRQIDLPSLPLTFVFLANRKIRGLDAPQTEAEPAPRPAAKSRAEQVTAQPL